MPTRNKTWDITLSNEGGTFNTFFKKWTGEKSNYDFESLSIIRKLLSNEKSRLIHTIKTKNPGSIYELAKMLDRDFKSVSDDINLLEKFGFIDLISEKTGNRERLKPVLVIDTISIKIKV